MSGFIGPTGFLIMLVAFLGAMFGVFFVSHIQPLLYESPITLEQNECIFSTVGDANCITGWALPEPGNVSVQVVGGAGLGVMDENVPKMVAVSYSGQTVLDGSYFDSVPTGFCCVKYFESAFCVLKEDFEALSEEIKCKNGGKK